MSKAHRWDRNGERQAETGLGGGQTLALEPSGAIHAARLGDDTAFGHLVDFYHGAAERVAYHILRTEEAAADAVQEAWIKAHRAIARFEDGNFRAWLLRIVTNTCYDHLRRQKRRPSVSLDALVERTHRQIGNPSDQGDPERALLRREQRESIMAAIDTLPPWHRQVILLVDVHGYDYTEASELLEIPLGTVKSRLSRGRSALRDQLVAENLLPRART